MRNRIQWRRFLLLALAASLFACRSGTGSQQVPNGSPGSATGATPGTGTSDPGGTTPNQPPPEPAGPVQFPVLKQTLAAGTDEGWVGAPALVDLDGDGKLDIVVARHSMLLAFHGDGSPLWKTAFGYSASNSPARGDRRMWAAPAVGDFDGDGRPEIAVASDIGGSPDANVAVYDHNGELLPGWPQKFGSTEIRSIAVADVDGDGHKEILVNKTSDGPSTEVLRLDGSVQAGWPQVSASCNPPSPAPPCFDYGGYNQNIGAADLDGDGVDDVVTTYDMMGFGIFRGNGQPFPAASIFADRVVTGIEAYHDYAMAKQGWGENDRSEFTDSPPVMADLFGDGNREVILVGNHETSQSTASRGYTLWVFNPDGTRPTGWETPKDAGGALRENLPASNIILTEPSPAVGRLGTTGPKSIVFPGYDGNLYAYSAQGERLWSFAFGNTDPYVGATEPLLVDLNGDGNAEVIFATFVSGAPNAPDLVPNLYVLSSTGQQLFKLPLPGRGAMAAPSVGDLDRDGTLELVLNLKDAGGEGGVQIWELPGSRPSGIRWGTGRGNPLRTGTATAP